MKIFISKNLLNLTIIFLSVMTNFLVHNLNLGKNQEVFTDAGVYIYSSKLITEGALPYRDFFLAHPPLLIYTTALWLKLSTGNIIHFHQIYICWVFLSLLPIYFLTLYLSKSRLAGILSIIFFSTFPELVQWDAHSFALRHASMPLLTFSLWTLVQFRQQTISAILLAFFASTTISNLLLSIIIFALIVLLNFRNLNSYKKFAITFLSIIGIYYSIIFLIPNSYNNLIAFQHDRVPNSITDKIFTFNQTLQLNWPIIIFGLLGSILLTTKKEFRLIGFFNLLILPTTILANSYFFGHYITILAPTFAIAGGYLLTFGKNIYLKLLFLGFCIFCIYQTSFNYLYFHLYQKQTTEFNQSVNIIEHFSGKLLTFEPIFALYTNKDIPDHYYSADSRSLLARPTILDSNYFSPLIASADIILLDNLMSSLMPIDSKNLIFENFRQISHNSHGTIFVRNQ